MTKNEMLALLRQDVVPALGCTEPVCVALAAADASKAAGGVIIEIKLEVSRNIYKNGMSVGIPGFDRVGLKYAAALGACIAAPEAGLEIMKGITEEVSQNASLLADNGNVILDISETEHGIYVRCEVRTNFATGISVIRGGHTNIVLTQVNDTILLKKDCGAGSLGNSPADKLKKLAIAEIRAIAASASEKELEFLEDGVKMNQTLADYGISENPGVGISGALYASIGGNPGGCEQKNEPSANRPVSGLLASGLLEQIMLRVASATEARLDGCPYPTMSSAGSGSKGIAVTLPVAMTAKALGSSRLLTLQALAFAHLLNSRLNSEIGKLSAVCSCASASSTAASAAITWLLGGSDEQIGWAIRNMTGNITGMICDGGKTGCALKLATASCAGLVSAVLAVNHAALRPTDGICGDTPEACIRNISRISNPGMLSTDREILEIMMDKDRPL